MRLPFVFRYIGSCVQSDVRSGLSLSTSRITTPGGWRSGDVTNYNARTKYTISYVHGHDHCKNVPTLLGRTIGEIVDETTEKYPDREFAVFAEGGHRRTFYQFGEESNRLAAGLLSIGLKRGDRVGIWGTNSLEWILTLFATARIGAILVNLNPAYQSSEIEYTLRKVDVKAIIASKPYKTQKYYEILAGICPELETASPGYLKSKRLPMLESVIIMGNEDHPGAFAFDDVMQMGGAEHHGVIDCYRKNLQFDDMINIQFTSGTTGMPKATCLTNFNIVNNMRIFEHLYPSSPTTVRCMPAPMFHTFGMSVTIATMMSGTKIIYPSTGFNAGACLQAIQDERCSSFYGTPTMVIDMLHHPDFTTFDLSSLTYVLSGGSHVPEEIVRQVTARIPSVEDIVIVYGMTEASAVITAVRRDDPEAVRYTTVGRPIPWLEVKIIDPSTGNIVPVNSSGELCSRGPCVMTGYWEDDEKTKEAIDPARWLHTGDLASVDEDGNVRIVGRIKDVVIRGGENISPFQIEQLLYTHPKIETVQVIGVPDERMTEELCACVKLKSGQTCTEEEIKEFCRGKISHYMVPRYVQFVSRFPLTTSGKVQKYKLQEEITELLKL